MESDEIADRIGKNVAGLIEDGACIHTGFDMIPQAILKHLKQKHDLGLHTEMFSDELIPLIENGIITNSKKQINPNKCVASYCMGTRKLFDFVADNPIFDFQPIDLLYYFHNSYNTTVGLHI